MEYKIISPREKDISSLNAIRTDLRCYSQLLSLTSETTEETASYFFDNNFYKESLVYLEKENILGYVQLRRDKEKRRNHKADISIAVSPERQSNGVGYKLMESIISVAKNQLMLHKLELTVLTTNKKAIGLYEKLGFKIEGELRDNTIVDGNLCNVYIMGKLLNEE